MLRYIVSVMDKWWLERWSNDTDRGKPKC